MSDLDELRALLAAATPGPWRFVPNQEGQPEWDGDIHGGNDLYVAHDHEGLRGAVEHADAALIVWLRNHAEALLADSLDAAWVEAEAALPEGWWFEASSHGFDDVYIARAYDGTVEQITPSRSRVLPLARGFGPTPAAALQALAAALKGKPA